MPGPDPIAAGDRVLVVDDDPMVRKSIAGLLQLEGCRVMQADSAEAALAAVADTDYPLVLSDVYLPEQNGLQLLTAIKQQAPDTAVVLMTGFARVEDAVTGMRSGAYDYVTKPVDDDTLLRTIRHALAEGRLRRENRQLRRQLGDANGFGALVGFDPAMQRIFEMAATVGNTDATVLITGESGTGKSSIARTIHAHSRRADGPLVDVSCGALAPTLLESELFGHVRGAFTGAVNGRAGKFEQARGGTIFLDEIDTLDPSLQVKLLRVLQERRFEPVGSTTTSEADVRIIAAANQDLTECMEAGTFRQDLYFRLNVVSFVVPPLRARLGDIPVLVQHFLDQCCAQHRKSLAGVTDEAMDCLLRYAWPGNIRELENVIERGVILSRNDVLRVEDLPSQVASPPVAQTVTPAVRPLRIALDEAESAILLRALEANAWNRQATAAALDINRTTLFHKMKKLGIAQAPPSLAR